MFDFSSFFPMVPEGVHLDFMFHARTRMHVEREREPSTPLSVLTQIHKVLGTSHLLGGPSSKKRVSDSSAFRQMLPSYLPDLAHPTTQPPTQPFSQVHSPFSAFQDSSSSGCSNKKFAANSSFLSKAKYAWTTWSRGKPNRHNRSMASRSSSVTEMGTAPGGMGPASPMPPIPSGPMSCRPPVSVC